MPENNIPKLSTVTIVRHEISQHLHNVYNANQLLTIQARTARAQSHTSQIKSNILSAMRILSNYIDYIANPEEYDEYMRVSFKEIDIVKFIRRMQLSITELITSDYNINLSLKTGAESIFVITDSKRLEKILYNLVSNSVRHAVKKEKQKIVWSVKETDDSVTVSVRDLSGGIETEDNIFEAYKSSENSAIDPATGLGLGLAATLKLASEMQAEIALENMPGIGAEFSVIMPKTVELPREMSVVSDSGNDMFEIDEELLLMYFGDVFE